MGDDGSRVELSLRAVLGNTGRFSRPLGGGSTDSGHVQYTKRVCDPDVGVLMTSLLTPSDVRQLSLENDLCRVNLEGMRWLPEECLLHVFRQSSSSVEVLVLDRCPGLTDRALRQVAFSLQTSLRDFSAKSCPNVSVAGALDLLRGCAKLERLELGGNPDLLEVPLACEDDELLDLYHASVPKGLRASAPVHTTHASRELAQEREDALHQFGELLVLRSGSLRVLGLGGVHGVGVSMMRALEGRQSAALEQVDLSDCPGLTSAAVATLAAYCPNLRSVDLSLSSRVKGKGVQALAQRCPHLQGVRLKGLYKVSCASVAELAYACGPRLRELDLSVCRLVTDATIGAVASECSALERLLLVGCSEVTEGALSELVSRRSRCARLELLDLTGCFQLSVGALRTLQAVASSDRPALRVNRKRDAPDGATNAAGLVPNWRDLPPSQQLKTLAASNKR